MDITSLLITLLIGAVAGWAAGFFVFKDKGGLIWNIIIGLLGGWVGGNLLSWLGVSWGATILGQIVTAIIGAVILLWIWNLIRGK